MSGERVVVTGGSRGIGRALVERFAAEGRDVVAIGRDAEALEALPAAGIVCDVTEEAAVAEVLGELEPVGLLVNNAGAAASMPLAETELSLWNALLAVNATGAFLCTRAVLPTMLERRSGRIVTVASTAGRVGGRYVAAYSASKHAAIGLMRSVAAEVAGTGVTANAVCPTFVATELAEAAVRGIVERTGRSEVQAREALASSSPLGRLLEPREVADAVAWLASDGAASVNGQALVIDGGGLQA